MNRIHAFLSAAVSFLAVPWAMAQNASPTASFILTPASPLRVGQTTTFDATASRDAEGLIAAYSWNFGDGTSGSGRIRAKTYMAAGTYTVVLTVRDSAGAAGTASRSVSVLPNAAPVPAFTTTPAEEAIVAGQTVAFDGTGSRDPDNDSITYRWEFHDGTRSTSARPSKQYATPGTYLVRLIVKDSWGLSATTERNLVVKGSNQPPVAAFSTNPATSAIDAGQPVTFDAAGSSDPDNHLPLTYDWTFSDGTSASGRTYTKSFAAGTASATLTVRDALGAASSPNHQVFTVRSVGAPSVTLTADPPATQTGVPVQFTAVANDPENDPLTYVWDFGDGAPPAAGPSVTSHVFQTAGDFLVTVTVSDGRSQVQASRHIGVAQSNRAPTVQLAFGPEHPTVGTGVSFTGDARDADDDPLTFLWNFGDGTGDQPGTFNVGHAYAAAGSYEARVTVSDGRGGIAHATRMVVVVAAAGGIVVDPSPHNGENVDVSLYGANLSFSTSPYYSMDTPRAVTLFYSSGQHLPRGLVQLNVTSSGTPPDLYSLSLLDAGGQPVQLTSGGTEVFYRDGVGGTVRLAAQFDAASLATGAYEGTAVVRAWRGGVASAPVSVPVRVLIVNERNSPYSPGWSIAGLQRIHRQSNGALVVTAGDGTARYYAPGYVRPAGEWSDIAWNGAEFIRSFRDGSHAAFDANGYLVRESDRFGNTTSYSWHPDGALDTITDPAGKVTTMHYRGFPRRLESIAAGDGRPWSIHYPSDTGNISLTDADFHLHIEYDAAGRLRSWSREWHQPWTVEEWDEHAGTVAVLAGPEILLTPSCAGCVAGNGRPRTRIRSLPAAVLAPPGTGSAASPAPRVDAAAVRVSVTNPRQYTTTMAVDRFGNPTRIEDPIGRVTLIARNQHSQVVSMTNVPYARTVTQQWDENRLTRVRDEQKGLEVLYTYEPNGLRRLKEISGSTPQVLFDYGVPDVFGMTTDVVSVQRPGGLYEKTKHTFDSRGRTVKSVDPEGHATFHTYDGWGENTDTIEQGSESGTARTGTRLGFDWQWRYGDHSISIPSHVWSYTRDTRSANSRKETLAGVTRYDAFGRAREHTYGADPGNDPSGTTQTIYTYSGGNVLSIAEVPGGVTRTWSYNGMGWATAESDGFGGVLEYGYDANGNRTTFRNRRQQVIRMTYDAADRMTRRDTPDAGATTWTYHSSHRLVTVKNAESTDEVELDAAGDLDVTRVIRGPLTFTLDETLDPRGRRRALSISGPFPARSFGFEYDEQGLLQQVRDYAGRVTSIAYDHEGLPETIARPSFTELLTYTTMHRLIQTLYSGVAGGDGLGTGYAYDPQGRIRQRSVAQSDRFFQHEYDALGQLTKVEQWQNAAPCELDEQHGKLCPQATLLGTEQAYRYDALGNPDDDYTQAGDPAGNVTVDPANRYRLTKYRGYTMQYDADGNLKSRTNGTTTHTFTWNSLGQLTEVRNPATGAVVTYGYDGLGRRVRRGADRFVYDGDDLLLETDANGNIRAEYTHFPGIDRPHSMRTASGAMYYYVQQQPGHVMGLVDSSGNLVNRYSYDPFGRTTAMESGPFNPLRFGGREWDGDPQLYYMRHRWYDPAIERFISEDPIGAAGGQHPYAYAGNDPVNYTDPTGLVRRADRGCPIRTAMGQCVWYTATLDAITVFGGGTPTWVIDLLDAVARVFPTDFNWSGLDLPDAPPPLREGPCGAGRSFCHAPVIVPTPPTTIRGGWGHPGEWGGRELYTHYPENYDHAACNMDSTLFFGEVALAAWGGAGLWRAAAQGGLGAVWGRLTTGVTTRGDAVARGGAFGLGGLSMWDGYYDMQESCAGAETRLRPRRF